MFHQFGDSTSLMAKQDDYIRYTIRVPAALYERLQQSAGDASVNAEIVRRLGRSFEEDSLFSEEREALQNVVDVLNQSVVELREDQRRERQFHWALVEQLAQYAGDRIPAETLELLQPMFPQRRQQRQGQPRSDDPPKKDDD